MDCKICENICSDSKYDCILDCLERIKLHYLGLQETLKEKSKTTEQLEKSNRILKESAANLQDQLSTALAKQQLQQSPKKRRKTNSLDSSPAAPSDAESSNLFGFNVLADNSTDDLNIALHSEHKFQEHLQSPQRRNSSNLSKVLSPRNLNSSGECSTSPSGKTPSILPKRKSLSMKKSFFSNENLNPKLKDTQWKSKSRKGEKDEKNKSISGNWNMSFLQPMREEAKKPSRDHKFRQSRLEFDIVKDESISNVDETFCDEIIEATQEADSKKNKSKTSQKLLRKLNSSTCSSDDHDDVFKFVKPQSREAVVKVEEKGSKPKVSSTRTGNDNSVNEEEKSVDSSSLVILTPEVDVICLDDQSYPNMESADLLDDLMKQNATESSFTYLREIEDKRIKQLQKAFEQRRQKGQPTSMTKVLDFQSTPNRPTNQKEHLESEPRKVEPLPKIKTEKVENQRKTLPDDKPASSNDTPERRRRFEVNCDECQKYLKFLGANLSDEEVANRLRNCKHNNRIDINPTPEGFWDPFIRTMSPSDPRNETLIDDRFVNLRK